MDSSTTFKSFQDRISSSLVDTTRTTGQIAAEDLSFHRSLSASIASHLDRQNGRLLEIAGKLTKAAVFNSDVKAPQLNSVDVVEENWQGVVDVIDSLLEKADACLDEYTGVVKRLSPARQEHAPASTGRSARPTRSFRDQDIPKPQRLFAKVPRNDESTPFKPLLHSKPHATLPLDQSLEMVDNGDGVKQYKHPYETEITQYQYPLSTYAKSEPTPYHPFGTTKATFVDTPEAVTAMVSELKTAKEIAVDLEHHDTHSYIGLVSLMQISTRDKDWVVDTLKPWRDQLQVLNDVFADPKILKVFHGAFMDMMWLQRDLGLYVVGLFDTFHASKALGYPKRSLASLLDKFARFKADKSYQTADWRIRPLPQEMLDYARSDTHYLLYVYDNLRNELVEKSAATKGDDHLVDVVLQKSKEEALQRFEWPFYDPVWGLGANGWYRLLDRTPALFSKEQFAVFKAVHQWRDAVAREEDESLHHVMPKHVMFNIATSMPMDMPSLLGVSHPISQPMRSRAAQLLETVRKAKEAGVDGPEMIDVLLAPETRAENRLIIEPSSIMQDTSVHVDAIARLPESASGELPYRSNNTQFWGSIFGSSLWHTPTSPATTVEGHRFAIPLPQLTAEVFRNGNNRGANADDTLGDDRGVPAEHQYQKANDSKKSSDDGIFVIKDMGSSRKRRLSDTQERTHTAALQGDDGAWEQTEIGLEDEEAQNRARRKAERKAQKKLKKEQTQGANGAASSQGVEPDHSQETEPFDYANAESVLHARRDFNDRGVPKKKVFDPYAKSVDAPKGMRKTKREIAGKSFTFPR